MSWKKKEISVYPWVYLPSNFWNTPMSYKNYKTLAWMLGMRGFVCIPYSGTPESIPWHVVLSRSQSAAANTLLLQVLYLIQKKKTSQRTFPFVPQCHTEGQNWGWSKIGLSVSKCSKQSIRGKRQMTGSFMVVGTEASIHSDVVMRRRADVSAYEYDIVLSVLWIWETSLYWLRCLDTDNQARMEKGKKKKKK